MFPGRHGVEQAAGASVAFSGFRGAALNQSRSASGVYTGLLCWHECGNQESASCDRGKCSCGRKAENGSSEDMTPPRSLSRCRSCRSAAAGVTCTRRRAKAYGMTNGAEKGCAAAVFHRLRPLTSITKSDAQISGGETRQDYKDTRRFPLVAPSCALLFLPFGLPVSFRCYGRVCLIPRLTLSSG